MSSLGPYVHVPVCQEALLNDDTFNTFKSNSSFTTILEHTNEGYSFIFLERIKNELDYLNNQLQKIQESLKKKTESDNFGLLPNFGEYQTQ